MVLSDDDVPPVLVHGSVVLSAEQNQVTNKSLIGPMLAPVSVEPKPSS